MNETKNDERDKTADGDPLIDRGIADSARGSVTEPDEEDDELEDDNEDEKDEEEEAEENVDL
jgi:hypothetical protein